MKRTHDTTIPAAMQGYRMSNLKGFWSYVHKDDEGAQGRICRLAQDVAEQFEMLTGESIDLFLDKDALEWGDRWKDKIDESLASVAFFMPVITPRYLMSPECRRELQFFARRAENLGIKELVLPLYYVRVPALEAEMPDDGLVVILKKFQWEDWRELRYEDRASKAYRQAVSRLAERLVAANRHAEDVDLVEASQRFEQVTEEEAEEPPGFIDQLASAEEAMPNWTETLTAIGHQIETIGKVMQDATTDVQRGDRHGKGFSHRLLIARRLAEQLRDPTDKVSNFGNQFASQLHDVDSGIRAIIANAPAEVRQHPEAKTQICEFFKVVRKLSQSAYEGLTSTQEMSDSIIPIEKMSRDLRPVLRKLRQGLTAMAEARDVTDAWIQLIGDSGVDCRSLDLSDEANPDSGRAMDAQEE